MTTARRRVLRPQTVTIEPDGRQVQLIERRRAQLEHEREGFERWMSRLRRACREVEKRQKRIARLERTLSRLEMT